MTLGNRIKRARERLGLTQKDVADAFRIADQAVSGWERDKDRPDIEKIPRLSQLLKVPCSWLLNGAGEPPDPDSLETRLEGLTPAERAILSGLIETLHQQRGRVA